MEWIRIKSLLHSWHYVERLSSLLMTSPTWKTCLDLRCPFFHVLSPVPRQFLSWEYDYIHRSVNDLMLDICKTKLGMFENALVVFEKMKKNTRSVFRTQQIRLEHNQNFQNLTIQFRTQLLLSERDYSVPNTTIIFRTWLSSSEHNYYFQNLTRVIGTQSSISEHSFYL
jgi:hypothetical protein